MDKSNIKVFNYCGSFIGAETKNRSIGFEGMQDGVPSMEVLTYEEVEYINAHSNVFRVGRLEFEVAERDEVFAALGIRGDETLYEREIDSLISHWSKETAERIVSITDLDTMERIRGHMFFHRNRADLDIPTRMVTLIDRRFRELTQGHVRSQIAVTDGPEPAKEMVSAEEVKRMLAEQQEALMAQFAEMLKNNGAFTTPPSSVEVHESVIDKVEEAVADASPKPTEKAAPTEAKTATTKATTARRGRPSTKKTAT